MKRQSIAYIARVLIVAALYFCAGKFGLLLPIGHQIVTLVWAPTGIALTAVLLWGYRIWPGLVIGAFLVNITSTAPPAVAIATAIGNPLEALVGAFLLRRVINFRNSMDRVQDIIGFVCLAAFASTMISATFGVTSLWLTGQVATTKYASVWFYWWLGDLMGDMLIAPVLLTWAENPRPHIKSKRAIEALALFVLLILVSGLAFGPWLNRGFSNSPLTFTVFPFLIWAALRFDQRESVTATLITISIAIGNTVSGVGPFVDASVAERLIYLYTFMAVASVTVMLLSASIAERSQAQANLFKAHQELEIRVEERTIELSRANAELKQFAYIASHDLQEPLRGVAGCLNLLQKRSAAKLDEKDNTFISHAIEGSKYMQTLIGDLLAYSRVGTRANSLVTTDLSTTLDQALTNLKTIITERKAVVTRDALPTLEADGTQMCQLFQNLIGNAIKFCDGKQPEVHIGVERKDEGWLISVRDNGIGIESQYADRIFQIFQRLHTRAEYPGTGIGLSICKKIVERHGGRIWLESVCGQGSTFYFTLPVKEVVHAVS